MKLNVLLWFVALLAVFLPRSADSRPAGAPTSLLLLLPRRGGSSSSSAAAAAPELLSSSSCSISSSSSTLLRLTQRLLQARAERQEVAEEAEEKEKRSDEPPISLDLTFHLLREVLEMARAEQVAQQADSNRKMMDSFGK
ncbi:corticoliberin-1 [Thunnus maccoyii]|uniref:corticoliberin-1 n=1 Tax=Thunnus maccoyii TaxID=8240 RepID=UPI001C4CAD37|nr:corticoliberin-1 [Thunnus maccoyii]XP_042283603.1 corticoliberin-1 [Thunnus maccoyii]XP_042283604.1 corticoliberin-1 [Thunnus maccoyii]